MKKLYSIIALFLLANASYAQQDQFVAEIRMFAGDFAPTGWAFCEGQILPISQNTALFSLLGTTYGGNGTSTFALPDLRERVVIGPGQGPGLSEYYLGQTGGEAPLMLNADNLPSHDHNAILKVSTTIGTTSVPMNGMSYSGGKQTFNGTVRDFWSCIQDGLGTHDAKSSASFSTSVTGNNVGVSNRQPYLVCNYIIALQGVFPPRP